MNNEILIKYPQKTIIDYDNEKIVITRKGAMNFLTQGIKGAKTIPIKSISSIQIKEPGVTNGYIQFGVLGGNESRSGVFAATQDENTVMFTKKYLAEMQQFKQQIENIMYADNQPQPQSQSSIADEIMKLKSLLDQGVINQEEFEQQKNKLLNS
ncbi:DUF4429 domain-containing protein [Lactobacillus salsicarnum]|nr:DUF4429 domain-containing protein [Companilactobacillus mishanensis]